MCEICLLLIFFLVEDGIFFFKKCVSNNKIWNNVDCVFNLFVCFFVVEVIKSLFIDFFKDLIICFFLGLFFFEKNLKEC